MAQHKWHKEIKAWADGAEIEWKYTHEKSKFAWHNSDVVAEDFDQEDLQFRIKPQPKEPQYLYAWENQATGEFRLGENEPHPLREYVSQWKCVGKIKLEQDDE